MSRPSRREQLVKCEALSKVSPLITEVFGTPIARTFNYNNTYYIWDVLNADLVIEHIIEGPDEFFALNIWLEADFEYTAQWCLAKCPLEGDVEKFIKQAKCLRDVFIETGRIFPCTIEEN